MASGTKLREELKRLREERDQQAEDSRALRQEKQHLEEENKRLRQQIAELEERLAALERAGLRQAAPFRRKPAQKIPVEKQKRPGRKHGHPGSCRPVPTLLDGEEELSLERCPQCGGTDIRQRACRVQYIEEIVPTRPTTKKIVTWTGDCAKCGPVETVHPWQTSTAQGAAKVQMGPRALALATLLNKGYGLTCRTTCGVLEELCGLRLSPGGLAQATQRVARKALPKYAELIQDLRQSPAVFCDETSWWVGQPGWWLWIATNPETTVYKIEPCRGSQVVRDFLGEDYAGILVSDCLSAYDPLPYRKHKCIGHHLQAIAKARDRPDTTELSYLNEWGLLLRTTLVLHPLILEHGDNAFEEQIEALEAWCDRLLARELSQPGDLAVQKRLAKQREHLFGCLHWPEVVEPTNNRSERGLRGGVIARKLSAGNKTVRGKEASEILMSHHATCRQRGTDFVESLADLLRLPASGRS